MTLLMGLPTWLKIVISIAFDIVDFFAFIPVAGGMVDGAGGFLAMALWGYEGSLAFIEVVLPNQVDAVIPSVTLTGLLSMGVIPLPI